MGSIGTPIVAVESATYWLESSMVVGALVLEVLIKRYYYYAHLRKITLIVKKHARRKTVKAGDVIGYLGMTGYSLKENVNNINIPHLHFGMQLSFDKSQEDGNNEI